MLNVEKDNFRKWVFASHNLFLSIYPQLNPSQKTEVSTIASTISKRWYTVNEKITKEKEKFPGRNCLWQRKNHWRGYGNKKKNIDVIFS
jgi:hypothetical protein